MIHFNECPSLKCTKINFISRVSLHSPCKMRRMQEEVNINALQMVFNFSDVFKCWMFIVRLMRGSECSVSMEYMSQDVMLEGAGSCGPCQLVGRELYSQALCHPSPVTEILGLSGSLVEMLCIFCEQSGSGSPLRHHGPAAWTLMSCEELSESVIVEHSEFKWQFDITLIRQRVNKVGLSLCLVWAGLQLPEHLVPLRAQLPSQWWFMG